MGLAIYTGMVLQYALRDYSNQLRFLLFSFNWSYLLACYLAVFIALCLVLTRTGVSKSMRFSRILLSILLMLLALIVYLIGYINKYYLTQYHGLSLVLIVFASINLLFNLKNVVEIILVLAILLCTIPIPLPALEMFSSIFALTTSVSSRQMLLINPGLALAGSIISTAPLILAFSCSGGFKSKLTSRLVFQMLIAVVVGFIGDVIRLFVFSQGTGLGALNKLFCSTFTYAFLSILSVLLLNRRDLVSCSTSKGNYDEKENSGSTFTLLVIVVFASLIAITGTMHLFLLSSTISEALEIKAYNYRDLMIKPASVILGELGLRILNENSHIFYDGSENILISEFNLSTNDFEFAGTLDLVKVPCKLYDLEVLLEYEGYRVNQKWAHQINDDVIIYYIAVNSSNSLILAERIIKLTIVEEDSREEYYARITLISGIEHNVGNIVYVFNNILTSTSNKGSFLQIFNVLKTLVDLLYVFIISLLLYISVEPLRRVFSYTRRILGEVK